MSGDLVALTVPDEAAGERLDRYLTAALAQHTRSSLRRLILDGRVTIDGRPAAKPGASLEPGMRLEVHFPDPPATELVPEPVPFRLVFEDDDLVVVDKPAGVVVHPGHGRREGTLVHGLLHRGIALAPAGGTLRPGIVHRLDRDTSGLIVVAKTDTTHRALAAAFARRAVDKTYLALVWGRPAPPQGVIERPIGRSRRDPTRMAVLAGGRDAVTHYRTLETPPGCALLEVRIATGRTHQIRVHLLSIHHPVVGDTSYGGEIWRSVQDPAKRKAIRAFGRLGLHASRLAFRHPVTGERAEFNADLPEDFGQLLRVLRGS